MHARLPLRLCDRGSFVSQDINDEINDELGRSAEILSDLLGHVNYILL